jgi:hypothetical protein
MLFDESKKSCFANSKNLLEIVSADFFAQVFFNQLFDLFIRKPLREED